MPELVSFGFSVLLFIGSWFALRRTVQDAYKDLIFDVRDEVRRRVAVLGKLDSADYRILRDTINGYIRFVEVADFTRVLRFSKQIQERPELHEALSKRLEERFVFQDPDIGRIARWARRRTTRHIRNYLFSSSLWEVLHIYVFCIPGLILKMLISSLQDHMVKGFSVLWASACRQVQAFEEEKLSSGTAEIFSQLPSQRKVVALARVAIA